MARTGLKARDRMRKAREVDEEAEADPRRQIALRYDRKRYAEALANGYTRREAMVYARNENYLMQIRRVEEMSSEPTVRRDVVARLEEKQHMILDYIDDMALEEADLGKLSAALGVITDRLRLYQGKATSISEKKEALSDADRAKIEKILARIGPARVHEGVISEPNGPAATNANGEPLPLLSGAADARPSGGDVAVADGGPRTEEVRV